jgi:uncharacterized protein YfaS (alpha-2-macroglobulin family)
VRAWQQDNRGRLSPIPSVQSNAEGRFEFPPQSRNRLILHDSHGDQQLSSANYLSSYLSPRRPQAFTQTQFFTDRAIYRPGQTIRYKGICLSADHENDRYGTLARIDVTIVFVDPNRKEIERLQQFIEQFGDQLRMIRQEG